MSDRKIQDESEVKRWYEQGKTYAEMQALYLTKYHLEISTSAFTNLRRTRGWERRLARDTNLIPWAVKPQHRHRYPVLMLRAESRVRAGLPISEDVETRLANFKRRLETEKLVVAYDPETDEGFSLVKPRRGRDTDLIREPDEMTTARTNPDA